MTSKKTLVLVVDDDVRMLRMMERILELVPQMHRAPFARGAQRVVTTVSIDARRDKPQTMESKVEAVLGKGP